MKILGEESYSSDWSVNASFLGPYDNFFHDTLVKKVEGIDKDGNPIIEKHYKNFRYGVNDVKKGDKITISGGDGVIQKIARTAILSYNCCSSSGWSFSYDF